ncbi:MAG: chromosomal replication initiator protein DnaA [Acidobacteria bacterium]|nr:chromosomal replication initiator protein DnaA [Acidobacteriota bacterium]
MESRTDSPDDFSIQNEKWTKLISAIENRVNHESFGTWFRPIEFVFVRDNEISVRVPDRVFIDWIQNNYREVLEEALEETGLAGYCLQFQVSSRSGPLSPHKAQWQDSKPETDTTKPEIVESGLVSTSRAVHRDQVSNDLPVNQKYTFETFVVGASNEFAHAAAIAVADGPSRTYNPLYLYGGVGLGKTHLMCAIGQRIRERNPHLRLCYISAERFMNELINAIRYEQTLAFRDRYRSIDVLLIDDIQFIAGKERTQEEFFHTFNALYESEKQIVISSDCPPREIPTLEERLHSRFEWGLIADVQIPDLETKLAILRRKAETEGILLSDQVAMFIARKIRSNIRELEGSLVRLTALSSLRGEPISLQLATEALKNIIDVEERTATIPSIQKVVADHFSLRVSDLKAKSNVREIAFPRQVAMYLCKNLTRSSLPEIGREFGGKHHTTVLHSVNKIAEMIEQNSSFHKVINSLIDRCRMT